MKRNISDLMDHYRGELPELQSHTPLSSQRIKELTMSKITKTEKKGKRIVFRTLVAAAIIASLTMTALAAEDVFDVGSWFRDILNLQLLKDQSKGDTLGVQVQDAVSEEQLEVINQLGQGFHPHTQVSQGTTVTLQAAYGADYILHLIFRVEAPERTVLPDGIMYDFCDYNAIDYSLEEHFKLLYPGEDAPYDYISYQPEIQVLPDDDPDDNVKDLHVTILGQSGTDCKFNDGYSKYFAMEGIYQQVVDADGDEDAYVLLAPGNFTFDVGLVSLLEQVSLKEAEGFTYGGEKPRTWTHDSPCLELCKEDLTGETDPDTGLPIHAETYTYEVTVESMTLSPLGVDWQVKYSCPEKNRSFGLDFRVVMKNGTSPIATVASGGADDGTRMIGTSYFTVPIDLAQVDYVIIGDEELRDTKILCLPE